MQDGWIDRHPLSLAAAAAAGTPTALEGGRRKEEGGRRKERKEGGGGWFIIRCLGGAASICPVSNRVLKPSAARAANHQHNPRKACPNLHTHLFPSSSLAGILFCVFVFCFCCFAFAFHFLLLCVQLLCRELSLPASALFVPPHLPRTTRLYDLLQHQHCPRRDVHSTEYTHARRSESGWMG